MKRIKFPDIPFLMLLLLLGLIGLYVHLWMGDQFTLINREISDRDSALRQLLAQQIRISLHGTGYFVSRVNKMSPQDMEELLHSVRRAEVDGLIALSSIGGNPPQLAGPVPEAIQEVPEISARDIVEGLKELHYLQIQIDELGDLLTHVFDSTNRLTAVGQRTGLNPQEMKKADDEAAVEYTYAEKNAMGLSEMKQKRGAQQKEVAALVLSRVPGEERPELLNILKKFLKAN